MRSMREARAAALTLLPWRASCVSRYFRSNALTTSSRASLKGRVKVSKENALAAPPLVAMAQAPQGQQPPAGGQRPARGEGRGGEGQAPRGDAQGRGDARGAQGASGRSIFLSLWLAPSTIGFSLRSADGPPPAIAAAMGEVASLPGSASCGSWG